MKKKIEGFFITIEGGEGVGKSTASKLLVDILKKETPEHNIIATNEPRATELGKKISQMILSRSLFPWTEIFLYSAARKEHVEKVIKPNLKVGNIVICDRYIDSTYIYQGLKNNISLDKLIKINKWANIIEPDLTILITSAPINSAKRIQTRKKNEINSIDLKPISYHASIQKNYLKFLSFSHQHNKRKIIAIENNDINISSLVKNLKKVIIPKINNILLQKKQITLDRFKNTLVVINEEISSSQQLLNTIDTLDNDHGNNLTNSFNHASSAIKKESLPDFKKLFDRIGTILLESGGAANTAYGHAFRNFSLLYNHPHQETFRKSDLINFLDQGTKIIKNFFKSDFTPNTMTSIWYSSWKEAKKGKFKESIEKLKSLLTKCQNYSSQPKKQKIEAGAISSAIILYNILQLFMEEE